MSNKKWKDYSEANLSGRWEGWPQPPFDITTLHGVTFNVRKIDPNGHLEGVLPDGRTQIATFEYVDINSIVLPPQSISNIQEEGKELRLDLDKFSDLNRNRAAEGFKTYKNVPITYWTTALAGEVGELCNMIKKQERVAHGGIDGGSSYTAASLTPEDLKEEIGGIFIYLDLISGLLGIDLTDAIIHTFNSKSEKYGFAQKYTPEAPSPASEAGELVHPQPAQGEILEEIMEIDPLQVLRNFGGVIHENSYSISIDTEDAKLAMKEYARLSQYIPAAPKKQTEEFDLKALCNEEAKNLAGRDRDFFCMGAGRVYHKMQEEIHSSKKWKSDAEEYQRLYLDFQQRYNACSKSYEEEKAEKEKREGEIQEYRKALEEITEKVLTYRKIHGDSPAGNHCRNIALEILAKYPHS